MPALLADAGGGRGLPRRAPRRRERALLRIWNEGRAHVLAFLDDHAALLEANLDLYRAGAGERFLARALELAQAIAARFFDAGEGDLFLTPSDGEPLAQRPRSDHDGATPHSTGPRGARPLRAAALAGRADLRDVALRVLRTHGARSSACPRRSRRSRARAVRGARRLARAGRGRSGRSRHRRARRARAPRLGPDDAVVIAAPGRAPAHVDASWITGRGPVNGQPAAYLCRGTTCSLPITNPEDLA
jgi:uncharacterized protein YyaL (SSP411 family)